MVWLCFCSSAIFADKQHVAPRFSLVNIASLNKILRSEVFVSVDGQLRMVHLILDFEPLSDAFQDVGNTIRAGEPQLRRIDVSVTGFLARVDLSLVELPLHHAFPETATPREEIASSCLSLEEEIDQFRLKEEEEVWEDPVEIPDSEGELDGALVARSP